MRQLRRRSFRHGRARALFRSVLRTGVGSVGAVLIAIARQATARADAPPRQSAAILVPACEAFGTSSRRVVEAVEIELRQEGVREIVARPSPGALLVELAYGCDHQLASAVVRISDGPASAAARTLDLGDIEPRSVPRALGLAVAELLRSMRAAPERTAPDTPPILGPSDPTPPTPAEARTAEAKTSEAPPAEAKTSEAAPAEGMPAPQMPTEARSVAWAVVPAAQGRFYVQHPTALWGGELSLRWGRVRGGIEALSAEARDQKLGRARFTVVALAGAFSAASFGPAAVRWHVAPRVAGGVVAVSALAVGEAAAADALEPYFEGGIELSVTTPAASSVRFEGGVALGYAIGLLVKAEDRDLGQVAGACASLRIGLAIGRSAAR